jgi:peptidyl-prolyl cis-trans isomerase SDCCAG10
MEADFCKLSRLKRGDDSSDDEKKKKKPKVSYLEQELSKFTKGRPV